MVSRFSVSPWPSHTRAGSSTALFTASRGEGAQLDGRRIRVSGQRNLESALIGTGFPFRGKESHLETYLPMLKAVIASTAGVRRPGAASLDLAYVAAGRLDGFWEIGLQPWDMAAGGLLIQEAGGHVTDLGGGPDYLERGDILAGNTRIHQGLAKLIGALAPKPDTR
jgi:myo-inositol-1(or 4)-monophosphatase